MKVYAVLSLCIFALFATANDRLVADSQGRLVRVSSEEKRITIRHYDAVGDLFALQTMDLNQSMEIAFLTATIDNRILVLGHPTEKPETLFSIAIEEDGVVSKVTLQSGFGRVLNVTANTWGELELLLARTEYREATRLYRATIGTEEGISSGQALPEIPGFGGEENFAIAIELLESIDPPPPPPPTEDPNG